MKPGIVEFAPVKLRTLSMCLVVTFINSGVCADQAEYSPPVVSDVPRQVLWGDTHLHTRMSTDAFGSQQSALSPEDAYLFASGKTITAQNGMRVKLRRPLDFLVVTDHAEYLGVVAGVIDGRKDLLNWKPGSQIKKAVKTGNSSAVISMLFASFIRGEDAVTLPQEVSISIWKSVTDRADHFNVPGQFTALIGYEYSSTPGMANLHRCVIYRDGGDIAAKHLPFSALDSSNPEDLWAALDEYEKQTGGSVLAIPHNGNLSNGRMFDPRMYDGSPLTVDYARTRSRWEPLYEVTQIKGDSETHPILSPNDEFADYERWNSWNGMTYQGVKTAGWEARKTTEYARSALRLGLKLEDTLDINPFKFGLIGSTDSHTSMSTVDEDNFWGKFGASNPSKDRWKEPFVERSATKNFLTDSEEDSPKNWNATASGLAAIWARENTREEIFDAMRRREVYATTGPRIVLRFFGGWDFASDADSYPDYVTIGYSGGVPMGGDLTAAPDQQSPSFIVVAVKDPDGANLDRIQIVKGWLDANGETHEKVYDVALSDNRMVDQSDSVQSVGSTVNVSGATYTNSIGSPELSVVWTDTDFNSRERAFYYVRALEIPTPRWTAYDAKFFGLEDMPSEVPMVTQERAYSSPIWYSPLSVTGRD